MRLSIFTYLEILEKIKDRLIFEYSTEKEYAEDLYERIKEKYKSVDEFKYYISKYAILYIYFDVYEIERLLYGVYGFIYNVIR